VSDPVAPLDAYVTAEPDEPTFTLQGGDPLAPPLVRLWAYMARLRAGVLTPAGFTQDWVEGIKEVAASHSVEHNEREQSNLLIRATAAEEVSWSMDEYQHQIPESDKPSKADETHLEEKAKLDLHDARVRYAQSISNMFSTLTDMRENLLQRGGFFCGEHDPIDEDWLAAIHLLKSLNKAVEPRRLMKEKRNG